MACDDLTVSGERRHCHAVATRQADAKRTGTRLAAVLASGGCHRGGGDGLARAVAQLHACISRIAVSARDPAASRADRIDTGLVAARRHEALNEPDGTAFSRDGVVGRSKPDAAVSTGQARRRFGDAIDQSLVVLVGNKRGGLGRLPTDHQRQNLGAFGAAVALGRGFVGAAMAPLPDPKPLDALAGGVGVVPEPVAAREMLLIVQEDMAELVRHVDRAFGDHIGVVAMEEQAEKAGLQLRPRAIADPVPDEGPLLVALPASGPNIAGKKQHHGVGVRVEPL